MVKRYSLSSAPASLVNNLVKKKILKGGIGGGGGGDYCADEYTYSCEDAGANAVKVEVYVAATGERVATTTTRKDIAGWMKSKRAARAARRDDDETATTTTTTTTSSAGLAASTATEPIPPPPPPPREDIEEADYLKAQLKWTLSMNGGDPNDKAVCELVDALEAHWKSKRTQQSDDEMLSLWSNKVWKAITRAEFPGSLGLDEHGRPMFTLTRMSFGRFQPGNTKVAIIGISNEVGDASYVFDVLFEVKDGPAEGLVGCMRSLASHQYVGDGARFDIMFHSGTFAPSRSVECDASASRIWASAFGLHSPVSHLEGGIFTAMDSSGAQEYRFLDAIEGYVDVLYLDDDMRITRGNQGSVQVVVN